MPLPVAHGLIGASVVALLLPRTSLKRLLIFLLLGAFLANSPDFDFFFVWILNLGEDWHRSFSHSFFFALLLTAFALLFTKFSYNRIILTCAVAFFSHTILDFLTSRNTEGVQLFFPFLGERLNLGVIDFYEFNSKSFVNDIFKGSIFELIIFVPIFLITLLIRRFLHPGEPIEKDKT